MKVRSHRPTIQSNGRHQSTNWSRTHLSSTSTNNAASLEHRRTRFVWGAFIAAMTVVGGILVLTDPNPAPNVGPGRSLTHLSPTPDPYRTVFDTAQPVNPGYWNEIIIEDSGQPHGSVETLSKEAQLQGIHGLPQHFLIGNGNGMEDGVLHMSYRWNQQQPAADTSSLDTNGHAIHICLVGNIENRPFTDLQLKRLADLVAGLQQQLQIPASRVRFTHNLQSAQINRSHFDPIAFTHLIAKAQSNG